MDARITHHRLAVNPQLHAVVGQCLEFISPRFFEEDVPLHLNPHAQVPAAAEDLILPELVIDHRNGLARPPFFEEGGISVRDLMDTPIFAVEIEDAKPRREAFGIRSAGRIPVDGPRIRPGARQDQYQEAITQTDW